MSDCRRPSACWRSLSANPYACSFLFFGPPGVGKTSMAMAMAEEMGAEFHHLGSQKCNLENLEEICRICQYVPLTGGFHFVLIDEVDSASRAAQLALLSKLDSTDAPKGTVFVFTCNQTDGLEPRFLSPMPTDRLLKLRHGRGDRRVSRTRCGTRKAETETGQTSRGSPKNAGTTSATAWDAWKWS